MTQTLEDHETRLAELERAVRLLELALKRGTAAAGAASLPAVEFPDSCTKCGRAILWARTTKNDLPVALDSRPGPYVVTTEGKADFRHAGGHAFHYDKTPEGCPAEVVQQVKEPEEPRRREWQDIYDR
jgi:hypothetical protein